MWRSLCCCCDMILSPMVWYVGRLAQYSHLGLGQQTEGHNGQLVHVPHIQLFIDTCSCRSSVLNWRKQESSLLLPWLSRVCADLLTQTEENMKSSSAPIRAPARPDLLSLTLLDDFQRYSYPAIISPLSKPNWWIKQMIRARIFYPRFYWAYKLQQPDIPSF